MGTFVTMSKSCALVINSTYLKVTNGAMAYKEERRIMKSDGHTSCIRFDGDLVASCGDDSSVAEISEVIGGKFWHESEGVVIGLSTQEDLLEDSTKDDEVNRNNDNSSSSHKKSLKSAKEIIGRAYSSSTSRKKLLFVTS